VPAHCRFFSSSFPHAFLARWFSWPRFRAATLLALRSS
jgi:hypothetical protein